MGLDPVIVWRDVSTRWSKKWEATHNSATLTVEPHNGSRWAWFVTGSHRPNRSAGAATVEAAKLAAETYELRGITQ